MRAISLVKPKRVELIDAPEPTMGPEYVLIEIRHVGLCGSDLSAYRGLSPMVTYPRIPGHEVGGVIIAKGEKVPDHIRAGAAITVSPYTNCGLCPACRNGRVNACQYNQTLGVQRDGAMAERIAIRYDKVHGSDVLTTQELALVEPLSVGYHASNRGGVSEVDKVLVLGCGAVGLGAVAASAHKGAEVIALDIDDAKLELAKRFGAAYIVNSKIDDVKARIDALTDEEGVSVAIEAVGLPETYRMAVERTAYAGRVVFIGYAKEEVAFQTALFVSKELNMYGSRNSLNEFPSVIKMLEGRERPFADMISRIMPFSETPQAFEDWSSAPQRFTKISIAMRE
jgi:threonine dehydrogenase-like Zn-dependent dehydrogenase